MKLRTARRPAAFSFVPLVCLPLCFAAGSGRSANAVSVDFVSDNPGLILSSSQDWGELGLNTAAHAAGQKAMPLNIGGKTYAKGLGSHARGEIVLSLEKQYSRFDAEIGVQEQDGLCGSVVFRARADGVEIFKSGRMDGSTPAQTISFPVEGVGELRLMVNDAGDGINCDLGNWAEARLTRSVTAPPPGAAEETVDMAPFARVVTWDPKRTDGARASRVEEFRAEDLFTETELKPDSDGKYRVPVWTNGQARGLQAASPPTGERTLNRSEGRAPETSVGCIGLQWLNDRALWQLALDFGETGQVPPLDAVKVEGWFGESAWQGHWQPLAYELRQDGGRLVCTIDRKARTVQTRKVRWILSVGDQLPSVRLSAFTRSSWGTTNLFVQVENPKSGARGKLRIENGEERGLQAASSSADQKTSKRPEGRAPGRSEIVWPLSRPLQLTLRYSRPSPFKSDPTVLEFQLPGGNVAVSVQDVLEHDCVYLPDYGLFVAREPLPVTLADYRQRIANKKTILEEVRSMPDQTFAQAMEKTHHAVQREGPVMLSLACDNTKFILERDGALRCLVYTNAAVSMHDARNTARRVGFKPTFGDGTSTNLTRMLDGEWLPIPVIEVQSGGVTYRQRSFVAPTDEPGEHPTRLNRPAVCVVEFTMTNTLAQAAEAALALAFSAGSNVPVTLKPAERGWRLLSDAEAQGFVATAAAGPLNATVQNRTLRLGGALPAGGGARCVVFLPAGPGVKLAGRTAAQLRAATENYWNAVLAPATQIETPDRLLNNVIRASQVRCLIAGRNEADGARIAAWIAAIAYGPLESESHSPIRGMDFLGHEDFARKSLDFFIHRYNTNGFLTTGYTTFGTAWHLWTVGEHYQLHRNKAWLKQVAPELARVCHWIVRQTEKTKKLDARGNPVPEYGLMPPGVLADWNSFAYHFCMNAYYVAALREVGIALKDIGHPDAPFFINQSEELRKNTMRAYAWTQSRAPALPLRNGTWIAHYPSQVHSPGNLADFFPGQDAGRSWCYNVELGAHQLVPAGVLAPRSREVGQMMDHMEDVQFLADGWFDYPATMNHADWFNNGGFSKVQPYYTRNAEIYAMRDEVKPFVRSYFNSIASLLNPEVLTFWEHFRHSGAWDKTHETGYFLQQTRFMLAMEHGRELWLAPLITSNWLKDGLTVSATRVPTRFGPVSFRIHSRVKDGYITAHVEPPAHFSGRAIVLRLRHPDGKSIRSVTVNGKPHTDFDATRETITLPETTKSLGVRAEF
jgi:hypothetical protein